MSDEERNIIIKVWPDLDASLKHSFETDEPCPVSIYFEKQPAHVFIHQPDEEEFKVDMNMNVIFKEEVPFCIKLCEPICARSDYFIGLEIFDKPFASFKIRGQTTIFNCKEEKYDKTHNSVEFTLDSKSV